MYGESNGNRWAGMSMKKAIRVIYLFAILGLILTGAAFYKTRGLVYGSGHSYVWRDIQSTGSNDDVAIGSAVFLFFIPLLIEIVQWRRHRVRGAWLFCVAWLLDALLLASMEVGSVWQTIFIDKNSVLATWVVCYFVSAFSFALVQVSRSKNASV